MIIIPLLVILSAFCFSLLQISKVIKFSKSKMNLGWFFGSLAIASVFVYLGVISSISTNEKLVYLSLLAISVWTNVIKFTLRLIQKREILFYNRFEHFMTGLIVFYLLRLLQLVEYFPIDFHESWASAFFVLLLVGLISIFVEIGELVIDLIFQKKYMIGPGLKDTNWDVTMTFLGSLAGFLLTLTEII